jgi:sugar lactone lactonase YvrE
MYTKAELVSWISAGAFALGHAAIATAYSPNDIIATYAGNGTVGYSGDSGPAVSAALNIPADVAVDSAGNLYISDAGNGTIRKVSTAGIITTIAGTGTPGYNGDNIPATMAQVYPRGITFDSAGDLYIADVGNGRIRKITFSTGLISTVAGTGANGCSNDVADKAVFSGPVGVAFDSSGTLYISEVGNRIVRKLSGGFVSSFAGTCTTHVFDFPVGLATDGAGNVYVADQGPNANYIWMYDSNGNRTVFAGNGAGGNTGDGSAANSAGVTLSEPDGIARDAAGNMFIGSGAVVRVVTPDGIIHTTAGNGTGGHSGDGGLATSAELGEVSGLAANAAGHLFITDISTTPRVRIVGPAAPVLVNIAGDGTAATGDGVASADGRINCPGTCNGNYVSGMPVILSPGPASTDVMFQWSGGGCSGNGNCTAKPATLAPTSVTAHFTPWYINTLLGGTVGPALNGPFGLAFGNSGDLYFTEPIDCLVRKRHGGVVTTVAGNGICGNLGDGIPAVEAELNNPQGVVLDSSGNIYIQDTGNGSVRKVTPDGTLHTFASGLYTGSNSPGIAIDSGGDLFVIGTSTTIVRLTQDGIGHPFETVTGLSLQGLANGIQGGLVIYGVGAYQESLLIEISAQGNSSTGSAVFQGASNAPPSGMTFNARGGLYYDGGFCGLGVGVAYPGITYAITAFFCGYSGDGGPAISATMNHPVGIITDSAGHIYVADTGNNAIRVIYPDAIFSGGFEQ